MRANLKLKRARCTILLWFRFALAPAPAQSGLVWGPSATETKTQVEWGPNFFKLECFFLCAVGLGSSLGFGFGLAGADSHFQVQLALKQKNKKREREREEHTYALYGLACLFDDKR